MLREQLRELGRRGGPFAAAAVAVIASIGTYAQFALPYPRGAPWPSGCYFGDALIVFIRCDASVPGIVEPVLTWSWYLTWGWFWLVAFFVPLAPYFGLPVLGLWIVTLYSAARWVWRNRPWRARRDERAG